MSACTTLIRADGACDRTTAYIHYSSSPVLTPKYLNIHRGASLHVTCLSTMIQTPALVFNLQSVVLLIVLK
jgi:hypothetical protein